MSEALLQHGEQNAPRKGLGNTSCTTCILPSSLQPVDCTAEPSGLVAAAAVEEAGRGSMALGFLEEVSAQEGMCRGALGVSSEGLTLG